jgi:uncharacterized protein YyaL (SSP411 family)
MTGSGGWPMTIIMTPEKKPFYAATYLPKSSRYGRIGLIELLDAISYRWKTKREGLLRDSEQITEYISQGENEYVSEIEPSHEQLSLAMDWFGRAFDKNYGGFGSAPKFPIPHNLIFLLKYSFLEQDKNALDMAEHSLCQMYRGGIFDHIGGGFSRYSTDSMWLAPHFEKMLYDNAMLIWAYIDAYALTLRQLYKRVAERCIDYVLRELYDETGLFHCGQDADSDGVEGKYYLFSPAEIEEVLGQREGKNFCDRFDITIGGNFEGMSIPNLLKNPSYEQEDKGSEKSFEKLYQYRLERCFLHKDDKALCSWNALMITALARAGRLLGKKEYIQTAEKAQKAIEKHLTDKSGRLKIRWREGESANDGQLDDYAFLGLALLELYASTFDVSYLSRAVEVWEIMRKLFLDEGNGGFFMYSSEGEKLLTRPKPTYDGALPSGNAVAGLFLQRLFAYTGCESLRLASESQLGFLAGFAQREKAGHSMALLAFTEVLYPSFQLVCVTGEGGAPQELLELISRKFMCNLTVILKTSENERELSEIAPFTAAYPIQEKECRYYLCRGNTCYEPKKSIKDIERMIV